MDFINVLLSLAVIVSFTLVVTSFFNYNSQYGKGLIYKIYLLNILTLILWTISMILYRTSDQENILLHTKILYVSATFIASSFYYFSLIFVEKKINHLRLIFQIILINIILVTLITSGGLIIQNTSIIVDKENVIEFGELYFLYVLYILGLFIKSFLLLYKNYVREKNVIKKAQIFYVFSGYTFSGLISFITNLLLPWAGIYDFNWMGQITTIIVAISVTCAIKKYKLFDIQIITIEFFVFILWTFTAIRILRFSNNENQNIDTVFLALVMCVGVILIKSVKKEAYQHEKNKLLIMELAKVNLKLKEVDDIKTRFVSLASHHMATPLTTIKGYVSLLKEENSDALSERYGLPRIEYVIDDFITIVKDFLDISKIESEDIQCSLEKFDLKKILELVLSEQAFHIEYKNISMNITSSEKGPFIISADKVKTHHAISNILENSIKYSKNESIKINLIKNKESIEVQILDKGIRSLPKVPEVLLRKFSPAGDITEANIMCKGLGVYIAKKFIEAQRGILNIMYDSNTEVYSFNIKLLLNKDV